MMGLLAAELNRLRSRRITLATALVVLLCAGLFQLGVNAAVSPPSVAEVAQGRAQYEEALREYERNKEQNVQFEQECLDAGQPPEACQFKPTLEMFVPPATPFRDIAATAVLFATLVAGLGSFLVAASFIGAEYTSGSLSNWLTFVPQRWKVFTAKAVAILLGCGLFALLVVGGTLAATAALTVWHDGEPTGIGAMTASAGRGVALVVVLALIGFGLTLLARHTAAAIGVLVAYGLVSIALLILTNFLPATQRLKPFQPDINLMAFLNNGHTYTEYYPGVGPAEDAGLATERVVTMAHGGVYWLICTGVALAVALLVFRRRDVT